MRLFTCILKQNLFQRCYSTVTSKVTPTAPASKVSSGSTSPSPVNMNNATGLSGKIVGNQEPVGPGAAKNADYKVPEYFNYNNMSYFEAEVEMAKYRCPQPSALQK